MPRTYDEACKAHATDQGLDPITEGLSRVFPPNWVSLDQTGGFTMLVRVQDPKTVPQQAPYIWINRDGEDLDTPFCVGLYIPDPDNPEDCCDTEEYVFSNFANLPEVILHLLAKAGCKPW